jgi:3-deoxy-D-manno-octulosonic-acid transferase
MLPMKAILWRQLYTTLFFLALPLVYLRLLWRSRRLPAYRDRMAQRWGIIAVPKKFQDAIWVHAVSFGEAIVATPLVKKLRAQYPDTPIVMTSMTPTGAAQIQKTFGDEVLHVYAPYDLPFFIKRFLNKVKPRLAIFIETELWPNYLSQLKKRGIPSMLANARLSEKSARGYGRFKHLMQVMLSQLDVLAAQAQADADRFIRLGADKTKVTVTGNIKFDVKMPAGLTEKARELREQLGDDRLVWIAGSTHDGEEEQVLKAFAQVKKQLPQALLMLVPRHPDRFEKVAELCRSNNYSLVLRSDKKNCDQTTDIFIGNSMGEMLLFYAVADVAFVGGSLIQNGGHNMLEPALFAKPIISGDSMFNFAKVSALLVDAEAMKVVKTSDELAEAVKLFFSDKTKATGYGQRALKVVEDNRGALDAHLRLVEKLL